MNASSDNKELLKPSSGCTFLDIGLFVVAVYLLSRLIPSKRHSTPLPVPPGPRPLPLLGNFLDFPKGPEGPHWAKHKTLYGPMSLVKAFGSTLIIINDRKIALELLDRRSSIYSDRPWFPFGGQMVGFERWLTTFKYYGEAFRMHRRLFRGFIGSKSAMSKFESLEELETRRFLQRVLRNPDNFMDYIRALPGALILRMTYGYTANQEGSDPFVALADEVIADIFSKSCAFGNWIVDILPVLRYLPEWLPGMGFKKQAREWSGPVAAFSDKPYAFVQHQLANGKALDCFVSSCIEKGITDDYGDEVVKSVASSMYAGGADTTVSSLATFYLAMATHPDVLRCAQEEIDRVVGQDRLPSFSDRDNLPYIEALMKEILRWENVVHINLPHRVMEEDTYMGYRIPKGSVILANIWQMAHDPEDYPEPTAFKPERFLVEDGQPTPPDPRTLIFGFGRRICPGKELADSSLFISIAMSAAVFSITKAKDQLGNEIEPLHDFGHGVISHPKPFRCSIIPRSEKAKCLIQSIKDEYLPQEGDGDVLEAL